MFKKFMFLLIVGFTLSFPGVVTGYGSMGAPSTSSTSSSSSSTTPFSSLPSTLTTPQKAERLNVDINALRSKLQERNSQARTRASSSQAPQYQSRRANTPTPASSWEYSIRYPTPRGG